MNTSAFRPRLGFATPWPPQASGIADYSAELVPALSEHAEVQLFVDPKVLAATPPTHGAAAMVALSELPRYLATGKTDLPIYQLGNDARFHGEILRMLRRQPGLVVLHEHVLHHMIAGMTVGRGDLPAYLEELRYAYGAAGLALGARVAELGVPLDPFAYPLFERVVDAAVGVIVHSQTTRERVLASRPEARVIVVPHHLSLEALPSATDVAAARRALALPPEAFVVASFGYMTPQKRLDVALAAFARLRETIPEALFLVVGGIEPGYDLEQPLLEAAPNVRLLGRTALPDFLAAMQACDAAVNLRYPSGGETSGTVIRLLGLGKPVVVSNLGSFAEIPAGCAVKLDLDENELPLLAAVLERLASDEELARTMGANARRHVSSHHALASSARAVFEVARQAVEERWQAYRAVPPLAPFGRADLLSATLAELASELSDLGFGPGDREAMAILGEAVVDLGLDRAREAR